MQYRHVSIVTVLLAAFVVVTGVHAQDSDSRFGGYASQLVRADELIGAEVRDARGERIARVDDLLLDSEGRSITHAVLTRGGFLGLGVKRHAVPWPELQLNGDMYGDMAAGSAEWDRDAAVSLNLSEEELVYSSPPLDREAWREYDADDLGRASRRVTDILGSDVLGDANDPIGEVEDLVIDADRGRVAYALVDYEGTWNLETRVLSVPWPSLDRRGAAITTSLSENTARQLVYRDEDFRRLGDDAHRTALYGATSSQGYWDDVASDALARGDASETRHDAAADQVTISGTIESVVTPRGVASAGSGGAERASGAAGEYGDELMFRLKTDGGSLVTVDAGAKAAFDRQHLTLTKGDRVAVSGHKVAAATGAIGDLVMATTIQKGSQTIMIERGAMQHKQPSPEQTKPRTDPSDPRG